MDNNTFAKLNVICLNEVLFRRQHPRTQPNLLFTYPGRNPVPKPPRSLGLGGLGLAAGAFTLGLFLVANGLGFVAVGAKLAAHGLFHRQDSVVKFPLSQSRPVSGGFGVGEHFGFFFLHFLHGFVGGLERFWGGLRTTRDIVFSMQVLMAHMKPFEGRLLYSRLKSSRYWIN